MATVTHKKVAVGADHPHAEINKGEWNDIHDVVMAPLDMGIYVGTAEPVLKTYAQWLSSRTGYWAWIDISGEVYDVVTATVMAANASGSVNPLAAGYSRYVTAVINPANAVGSIAKLVAQVTAPGQVSAEVKAANATGMVAALTSAYIRYMAGAVGAANSAGAIDKLVASYARYMTASVGAANAAGAIAKLVATVTAAGGPAAYINTGTEVVQTYGSGAADVPYPASIQANDLLLLVVAGGDGTTPSGFTVLIAGGNGPNGLFYRVCTGSESGAVNVPTWNDGESDVGASGVMFHFRNSPASAPIASNGAYTAGNMTINWTGGTLTGLPSGALFACISIVSPAKVLSSVGGGIDTLDSSSTRAFHLGYKTSVTANPSALTLTWNSAPAGGEMVVVAIKGT